MYIVGRRPTFDLCNSELEAATWRCRHNNSGHNNNDRNNNQVRSELEIARSAGAAAGADAFAEVMGTHYGRATTDLEALQAFLLVVSYYSYYSYYYSIIRCSRPPISRRCRQPPRP